MTRTDDENKNPPPKLNTDDIIKKLEELWNKIKKLESLTDEVKDKGNIALTGIDSKMMRVKIKNIHISLMLGEKQMKIL